MKSGDTRFHPKYLYSAKYEQKKIMTLSVEIFHWKSMLGSKERFSKVLCMFLVMAAVGIITVSSSLRDFVWLGGE